MNEKLYCVEDGRSVLVSLDTLTDRLSGTDGVGSVTFLVGDLATQTILIRMSEILQRMVPEKLRENQEKRIETMLSVMMDLDPLDAAEARIDLRNAEKRQDFLRAYPVIEGQMIHKLAGHAGSNASQTAASWRSARKILGLPFGGRIVYPRFQFDADNQPYALMRDVLKALPDDMTPWQIAFWIVSPNAQLDTAAPIEAIRRGDTTVIAAAERECLEVIG